MPITVTVQIPHITVHVHHDSPAVLARLDSIDAALAALRAQGVQLMADVTAAVREVLTAIDTETNALATRIETKLTALAEGMDEAEAAPLLEEARAIAARLRSIAADPEQPVPPADETTGATPGA